MNNTVCLSATIKSIEPLRYSPAGIPILLMEITHESWQEEAGERYLARFETLAKLIGKPAQYWQNQCGKTVEITGFLAAFSQKHRRPILHIQTIEEKVY